MKPKLVYEGICGNKKALGLVSLMKPVDLMRTLVSIADIHPKDAAKVVLSLKRRAEGVTGGTIETNKEFPVPSKMRSEEEPDDEFDEFDFAESATLARGSGVVWGGPRPGAIKRHHFPPDPRAHAAGGKGPSGDLGDDDDDDGPFPYGATFKNYMNGPKRKKGLTSGREPKVRHKNPLDIDLRSGQPGGAGSGIYQRGSHSKDNSTPGGGSSWPRGGASPGWASSPKGQEFDPHQRRVAKQGVTRKKELKIANAGDDDDVPSIFKQPNTGGTIWDPMTGKSATSTTPGNRKGFRRR